MKTYTNVVVIYNPNSTGASEMLARQFAQDVKQQTDIRSVSCRATEHAGHAEEIAYQAAKQFTRPLIVSSSGDGGYHEVVNGIVRANQEGAQAVAGLLPAGNANDHHRSLHDTSVIEQTKRGEWRTIDLLQLEGVVNGKKLVRYGHSYIGLGLTPKVGRELNRTKLNWFNQIWIVLKMLFVVKPSAVIIDGKKRYVYSLVFSNIDKMSKVLSLSQQASVHDAQFEVTIVARQSRHKFLGALIKSVVGGAHEDKKAKSFNFTTVAPTLLQIDGEVITVDAHTNVTVLVAPQLLRCVV